MILKNNRVLLLYHVKLCASFQIHQWIQTGVTVRKRSIRVEIGDILSRLTLKFDGWPCKTIGHLFYNTSSCVHYFKSIGEVKLELQSGNTQFGSTLMIFCPVGPRNLMDDLGKQWGTSSIIHKTVCIISNPSVKSNLSYSPETLNLCQTRQFFVPWDLENWRMTLYNKRAPLLRCFKLCASFHSHWWIQTGVTVRTYPFWVKIKGFLAAWPWNLTDDLEKQ